MPVFLAPPAPGVVGSFVPHSIVEKPGVPGARASAAKCSKGELGLNFFLAYVAWYWDKYSLQQAVELNIALENLTSCIMPASDLSLAMEVIQPQGVEVVEVRILREVLPRELCRASVRHRILRHFCNRLLQSFSIPEATYLFEHGWLFDRDGHNTTLSLERSMLLEASGRQVAFIDSGGSVSNTKDISTICAHVSGGVIIDLNGDTLATLEMAEGCGCPDGFLPVAAELPGKPPIEAGGNPWSAQSGLVIPLPSGRWSDKSLFDALQWNT